MSDDLQAELDALRAKRVEIEARRETVKAKQAIIDEIESTKRAIKEAEVLEGLEAEHGPLNKRIKAVSTPEGMIVVKKPNHVLFKKFVDTGKTRYQDFETLVRPHVLYPDKTEFQRLVEEYPAAMTACANAICTLGGVGKTELEGE